MNIIFYCTSYIFIICNFFSYNILIIVRIFFIYFRVCIQFCYYLFLTLCSCMILTFYLSIHVVVFMVNVCICIHVMIFVLKLFLCIHLLTFIVCSGLLTFVHILSIFVDFIYKIFVIIVV